MQQSTRQMQQTARQMQQITGLIDAAEAVWVKAAGSCNTRGSRPAPSIGLPPVRILRAWCLRGSAEPAHNRNSLDLTTNRRSDTLSASFRRFRFSTYHRRQLSSGQACGQDTHIDRQLLRKTRHTERHRQAQTHRKTQTGTDTQKDTDRHRHTERHRQAQTHRKTQTGTDTDTDTEKDPARHRHRHRERDGHSQTQTQRKRWTQTQHLRGHRICLAHPQKLEKHLVLSWLPSW